MHDTSAAKPKRPRFVMVFEDDMQRIEASAEHPATIQNVWTACCRCENDQRGKGEAYTFTLPIRYIATRAGLRYRATKDGLDTLESIGLLRIHRHASPGRKQPDSPSTYEITGRLREYRRPEGYAPRADGVCTGRTRSGADSLKEAHRNEPKKGKNLSFFSGSVASSGPAP